MKLFGVELKFNGFDVWHSGNDGSGSGLDADLLGGIAPSSTNTVSTVVSRDSSGNFAAGTITATLTGNASTTTKLATGRTIALTGDVTGTSAAFDGSANLSFAATLASVGTAGTYKSVTTDNHGRVTSGTNPTTLSGYGITDAVNSFRIPATSGTVTYFKIAELTTAIGAGENGGVMYVQGSGDFGSNQMGVDVLQFSTRGSSYLRVLRLFKPGSSNTRYGYVVNATSGLTEIWIQSAPYNYEIDIIVGNAIATTRGNLLSQTTAPSGLTLVTPTILGDNATGNIPISNGTVNANLNSDKIDGCDVDDAGTTTSDLWTASKITAQLATKEPAITKNTAFNVNFETTATNIKMNGIQSVGALSTVARADHAHPVDTSRAAASHTHTKSQITDMPTKLSEFINDIGAGSGLNIIFSPTEPALNPGDWWYKEV